MFLHIVMERKRKIADLKKNSELRIRGKPYSTYKGAAVAPKQPPTRDVSTVSMILQCVLYNIII